MLFKFKKKKIVVDVFTNSRAAYELFPIQPAIRHVPNWFKKIPSVYKMYHDDRPDMYDSVGTLKNCPGFINLYKTGFILPAWCDIQVNTFKNGEIDVLQASSHPQRTDSVAHADFQLGAPENKTFNNLIHTKFHPPWQIHEKTGIRMLMTAPSWNQYPSMVPNIVPGIVDIKCAMQANINTFWPKISKRYEIEAGTPMLHIIPLTEDHVELKTHLVTQDEWVKLGEPAMLRRSFFYNQIQRIDKQKLKNEEQSKKSKCPFGFK